MKTTTARLKTKKPRPAGNRPRDSRNRILAAGRQVFTAYPYGAAGVRKIETTGGVSYALLRYYFGSKKGLFEAVVAETAEEYGRLIRPLLKRSGASADPEEGLLVLIDQLVDFCFDHPDGPGLIMLNIEDPRHLDGTLMGGAETGRRFDELRPVVRKNMPTAIADHEITGWMFAFTLFIINFIGARNFHAASLGLAPDSSQYRQWVKAALQAVFRPVLARRLNDDRSDTAIMIPENAQRLIGDVPLRDMANNGRQTKGDLTREKILDAAEAVFTKKSYHTAGLRQIGREGDFDFTIIHHYFPTKKALAEAVSKRIFENFFQTSTYWWLAFADRKTTRPLYLYGLMSQYFDRLLTYYFDHPKAPAILMQNIAHPGGTETLPGFEYSMAFFSNILERLKSVLPMSSSEETIRMWQYCLVTFINHCVGAPAYPSRILQSASGGAGYREWVKAVIMLTFYPGLKQMLDSAPG